MAGHISFVQRLAKGSFKPPRNAILPIRFTPPRQQRGKNSDFPVHAWTGVVFSYKL